MKNKQSRREFLELALAAGVTLPFLATSLSSCSTPVEEQEPEIKKEVKKLKILILGGTSFLGPHQIAYALQRGHSVTTFTRGKTIPTIYQDLFKQVEQLIGDREDNLTALENRKWDVVIDNSGRKVEWTKKTANLLKDNVDLYLYTSSTGVYYPYLGDDFREDKEVLLVEPEGLEDELLKMEYGYGVMKSNSEREAQAAFGKDRTIVVRPTYMIGPADRTNRFAHWPARLSKGGETLVPGKREDLVQYIDVRDVAEWMIRLIEEKKTGTFNAVGPKKAQNMYSFVEKAQKTFDVEASFVRIDDYDFLKENKIYYLVPWLMLEDNNQGTSKISNTKGVANGLTFRPLKDTMLDTHQWWYSDAVTQERRDKVESDSESIAVREKAIIEKWKKRKAK